MDRAELAAEVTDAARAGDHARLHLLNRGIRSDGTAHISDVNWSRAKSAMTTVLASGAGSGRAWRSFARS